MTRRALMLLVFVCYGPSARASADIRIGVLGLFHPRRLIVRSADERDIALQGERDTCVLRGREPAHVQVTDGSMRASCGNRTLGGRVLRITSGIGGAANIELTVPDKLARTFRGRLDITADRGELAAVVFMDLETAVASVVAAEQLPGTPIEALEAQAVAARSYFVAAAGRHRGFDFCDTTHCQFLREPPGPDQAPFRAAGETSGLVLTFHGAPMAAFYSASCGGRTRSLGEAGLPATDGYPYVSVECSYCARHGQEWERRLTLDQDAERLAAERSEGARLAVGRRNGWSVVPGNTFDVSREERTLVLHGRGAGHGIGLCQAGAAAMAKERRATFSAILAHYYPGAALEERLSPLDLATVLTGLVRPAADLPRARH